LNTISIIIPLNLFNFGIKGSTSVIEKQSFNTKGSKSTTKKHDFGSKVEKFNWKSDVSKSEWILTYESEFKSPKNYDEKYRDRVMKLPNFQSKLEEHYIPQQWQFGFHNRDLQVYTTVASTIESKGSKISLDVACNL